MQCYEAIDATEALYEWNYPRQLLISRLADAAGASIVTTTSSGRTTSSPHSCCRPSSTSVATVVLLIDEVDRADDEFEAFLLQRLAEAALRSPSSARASPCTRRSPC